MHHQKIKPVHVFYPNIANNGEICVDTLKKDWNPTLGLRHVLLAGKMLLENYEEYARLARLYTGIHAKPKSKPKKGAISESTMHCFKCQPETQNAGQESTLARTKAKSLQDQPVAVGMVASALPLNENCRFFNCTDSSISIYSAKEGWCEGPCGEEED